MEGRRRPSRRCPDSRKRAWGPDGDIVFRPDNRVALFRIRESGGSAAAAHDPQRVPDRELPSLSGVLTRWPSVLFVSRCSERANNALYIGSLDSPEVVRLMPAQSRVSYVPAAGGPPGDARLLQGRCPCCPTFRFGRSKAHRRAHATLRKDWVTTRASIEARFRVSADGRVVVVQHGEPSQYEIRLVHSERRRGECTWCTGRKQPGAHFSPGRPGGFFTTRPADWQSGCVVHRNRTWHHIAPDDQRGQRLVSSVVARRPATLVRFGSGRGDRE